MKNVTRAVAVFVFLFVAVTAALAATTVVVNGDTAVGENTPGWLFNRDVTTMSPFEFNSDEASIGVGSLHVMPIGANPSDKFIGENFVNKPIADIGSISYDYLIGAGASLSDANEFYMSVYANFGESDDLKFYDCRYSVVPAVGSQTDFTTVTFDPTQPYPVAKRATSPYDCPAVPADMDLMSPGSNIRMFSLNVGDTTASDTGVEGYLDNVVVTVNGDVTVYDFEPILMPMSKDECKGEGWMSFNYPFFKNQGDCVSYVQSSEKAVGNKSK